MNAETIKSHIDSIEQEIFAIESAERAGYERLRKARLDLVQAIVQQRPFDSGHADDVNIGEVADKIQSCWTSLLHHRWEVERPVRTFETTGGWLFRAEAEDPATVRVSLEPAGLDEIDALDGMPRTAMPIATGTAGTINEAAIFMLDEGSLRSLLQDLIVRASSGYPISPEAPEHLGAVA